MSQLRLEFCGVFPSPPPPPPPRISRGGNSNVPSSIRFSLSTVSNSNHFDSRINFIQLCASLALGVTYYILLRNLSENGTCGGRV